MRQALMGADDGLMLFKVGRFDASKRWMMAVEAAAQLKAQGQKVVFVLRGGIEPHGREVMSRARYLGLEVTDIMGDPSSWDEVLALLGSAAQADVYNLRFFMSPSTLSVFYAAADAVLANSGHEPFGLVGLEAMAAGGLVFTGATGEEYSFGGQAAVVLDTDRPEEIVSAIYDLKANPARAGAMRAAARARAARFTWEQVSDILLEKVRFIGEAAGALPRINSFSRGPSSKPVEDVVIYTIVHQPCRLRLPAQPLVAGEPPEALAEKLFDDTINERYFRKVAQRSYYPATERFLCLVEQGLKLSIGFSHSFIEQAWRWDQKLLDRFRALVQHENVELVAVEPSHSFVLLWDIQRFLERMLYAVDELEAIFGVRPAVTDTTELMMSDTIYHALNQAGFRAGFIDGRPWVMNWRQPTYLYHHNNRKMKLLTRHHTLSDDVGYRFSNRGWDGWPLMADHYARWLANNQGNVVVLGWDFETFGEHHAAETGIFDFLEALPTEIHRLGLSFITPSEAVDRYGSHSYELPLPAFASTWAGSGGLEFFLGNQAQQSVFRLMMEAYNKALLTRDPALIELALRLAQSDNLHLIQWFGRTGSEAEVSAYFTPQEWWSLGPERIIWEIQQVYKNFIAALCP